MKTYVLYTKKLPAARKEIKEIDGRITQEFTEDLFVASLPDTFDVGKLKQSTTHYPANLSKMSRMALNAWNQTQQKDATSLEHLDATHGLSWDTEGFQPPRNHMALDIDAEPLASTVPAATSQEMTGSVAVGIIIVSGPNDLAISDAEATRIMSEVQQGLRFLAAEEPTHTLVFRHDLHVVFVNAAPGNTTTFEAAEAPWRDQALGIMGFTPSAAGSLEYVNQLRTNMQANWAYVAFFTKYQLAHFAYAIRERVVMNYFNDGWGPININRVFAHETCHIFGAADEYNPCDCNSVHGIHRVRNENCRTCAANFQTCLMESNDLVMCNSTKRQIGWNIP